MAKFEDAHEKQNRLLLKAATAGDVAAVEKLLDEGADVDFYQENFFSMDKTPLICAASRGRAEVVKCLIARGASVDFQTRNLYTALMHAAYEGHVGCVEALLDGGAILSLSSKLGNTARSFASGKNKYNIVKLLDVARAGKRQPKELQKTPLKEAALPLITGASADEIVFERPFLGNRLLQEVFNFQSLERFSVIRKDAEGPVENMTREPFSSIASQPSLRAAFEEHVRRGGKVAEEMVFGRTNLPKHKFPPNP